MIGAGPFHRHQHRASPFAADADALDESQDGQDHRAPDSNAFIGGDDRHGGGSEPHQQQRRDQRRLAADAVAVVPEDGGADRAGNEADRVDAERLQRSHPRVGMREEQFCEHQPGDRAVKKEVVPFDRGADGRGDHRAAKLNLMLGWGKAG
jgi:hypothetical protein